MIFKDLYHSDKLATLKNGTIIAFENLWDAQTSRMGGKIKREIRKKDWNPTVFGLFKRSVLRPKFGSGKGFTMRRVK